MLENATYTMEQAPPRRWASPYLVTGLWIAAIALVGAAIQAALPPLVPAEYGKVEAFYGAICGLGVSFYALTALPGAKAMQDRSCAAVLLFVLAVLTGLGTFVVVKGPPTLYDVHHTLYMTGLLGMLGGMQFSAILSRRAWQGAGIGRIMLIAHGGILLILSGAAIDTAFGSRGVINLHDGGESRIYSETVGLSNTLTGNTGMLARSLRLDSIDTEYHDQDVYLRLYHKGALVKSWPVTQGLEGVIAGVPFRIGEYLPDAALSRDVTPSSVPTGKAAALVSVEADGQSTSDWLFSEAGNYGFIKRPDGSLLVRFFMKQDAPPNQTARPELQIDGTAGRWRVTGGKSLAWSPLPDLLDQTIDGVRVTVARFMKNAVVEDKVESRSDKPKTPVIQLDLGKGADARSVFLSPLLPVPVKLNAENSIVSALTEPQPSMFTSHVTMTAPDGTQEKRVIRVNSPLHVGFCKIYQSDFDPKDPSYSGFLVNCAPGTWIVKTGMAFMILGLLGSVFYGVRFAAARRKSGASL